LVGLTRLSRGLSNVIRSVGRGLLILLVLVVVSALSISQLFPRNVTPASAPPSVFSAERAIAHLPAIAAEPHPTGSPAQARVRDYLVQQLVALGLETQVQRTVGPAPALGSGRTVEVENVVARLRGNAPTGAVLVLSHYDSVPGAPGGADNGSGVAALLESMRALAAGPQPRNDVIALFDDGEELFFVGAQAFVAEHPWMPDVRVAIGTDTAVGGLINVNETGPRNGWLVNALARAYTGGTWSSASGGGTYEYFAFRQAGVQGLELEDNYAFRAQHTAFDRPDIVSGASVQQLGEQVVAVTRELGNVDLSNPWDAPETFFSLPPLGFIHYPQAWAMPLAMTAAALFLVTLALALRRRLATWRGLGLGLLAVLGSAVVGGVCVGLLWVRVPDLLGWNTAAWPEWPEVFPPDGERFLLGFGLLVLAVVLLAYVLARRGNRRVDLALAGLAPWVALSLLLPSADQRLAYVALMPALIGSIGWLAGAIVMNRGTGAVGDLAALPAAIAGSLMLVMFPTSLMSSGFASVGILAGAWALLLGVLLPALDGLVAPEVDSHTHKDQPEGEWRSHSLPRHRTPAMP
jgi:hypothetical protein